MATEVAPGEGPAKPVSVSLHEGTTAALKARTGKRGMSTYVETLIQRQLEGAHLRELIEEAEREHGPVDQAGVDAKRAIFAVNPPVRRAPREWHPCPAVRQPRPIVVRI